MYNYIIGTVTEVNANNISLDNSGVGYLVYTPNPYMFELGKEYKVYIYEQVREDEHSLYGFKDMETKELYLYKVCSKHSHIELYVAAENQ